MGIGQGTQPKSVNSAGAIAGDFIDAKGVLRGFLLAPGPVFTRFDVRGMGTSAGQGTVPQAISATGAIAGFYIDRIAYITASCAPHGRVAVFEAPGAGTGPHQGTIPVSVNAYATSSDPTSAATIPIMALCACINPLRF